MSDTQTVPNGAVNTNSTESLVPMILYVPWKQGFELGMGYDYMTQASMGAVIPATEVDRPTAATSKIDYKYVTSQDDFDQLIQASLEGSGDLEGVTVKASLDFTKSVRFSETSETLVFSWYSDSTHFDRIKTPTLDTDAIALAGSDPEKFRLDYGDYFISGGLQRAEFHAVYQMSAVKRDDLLKFKASLSASTPDVFSTNGSTAFSQAATSNHVSISATVYSNSSTAAPSMGSTTGLTPAQVLQMFTDFQTHHQDGWAVAELTHFNKLVKSFEHKVPVPPSFAVDRALLVGAMVAYHGLLAEGLLPRDAAASLKLRQTALDAKVQAEGALYWDHPDSLAADSAAAQELAADARRATEFLHRVRILGAGDGGKSNLTGPHGGEAGIGTHGDQTAIPADVEVSTDAFDLKGDWEFAHEITRHADKSYPGCTIIYIQARNNWGADTGGTLNGFSGGIGQSAVHVGCTSVADRGLSWSFVVKYVESE
ncbi:hypothetical protein ABZ477_17595 [Microbacterium sp. NPDC019599]|uniref:hypothetical protein n=1 Tax=Microbacterium sp. NPDC019599 TaxID=3154690 RepID=UPI0033C9FD20